MCRAFREELNPYRSAQSLIFVAEIKGQSSLAQIRAQLVAVTLSGAALGERHRLIKREMYALSELLDRETNGYSFIHLNKTS